MSAAADLADVRRYAARIQEQTGIALTVTDSFELRGDRWGTSASNANYVRGILSGIAIGAEQTPSSFEGAVADWMRSHGWSDVARVASVRADGWEGSPDTEGYGGEDRFDLTITYVTGDGRTVPSGLDAPEAASLWNFVMTTGTPLG